MNTCKNCLKCLKKKKTPGGMLKYWYNAYLQWGSLNVSTYSQNAVSKHEDCLGFRLIQISSTRTCEEKNPMCAFYLSSSASIVDPIVDYITRNPLLW